MQFEWWEIIPSFLGWIDLCQTNNVCFPFAGLENIDEEDAELFKLTNPKDVKVPNNYKGPQLKFPLSMNQVESLIDAFKRKQVGLILFNLKDTFRKVHEECSS